MQTLVAFTSKEIVKITFPYKFIIVISFVGGEMLCNSIKSKFVQLGGSIVEGRKKREIYIFAH